MPENPYDYSLAVREPNMFFGRRELAHSLYEAFLQKGSIKLRGMRRIGKTSLLKHLQSTELREELGMTEKLAREIIVSISMRDYGRSSSEEDFFRDVYQKIVNQSPYPCAQPENQGKEWSELFKLCLLDLHAANYHVVLFMDVFDKIMEESQFGPQFFSYLRAHAEQFLISYVTTSILPLHTILINGTPSPFFNIFKSATIGPLEMDEAIQLIQTPSAEVGLPCSPEEVEWVIGKAGRNPFFLQVSCYYLIEEKSRLRNDQILDFEQLGMKIYKELTPHFPSIWNGLSEEEQNNFKRIIQRTNRLNQDRSIMDGMEEIGESELFRRYIRTTFHVKQADISVDELKTILEHYQDREFLAKSVLATMHYVEAKLDGNKARSYQIGTLVQEFVQEAFERMKPAGTRSDVSEVWRSYNIIHFRYIRQQLATEYIAPKLGIGRRQYFRSLEAAIKDLRRQLLELDDEAFEA